MNLGNGRAKTEAQVCLDKSLCSQAAERPEMKLLKGLVGVAGAVVPHLPRSSEGHQSDLGWSEKPLLGSGYLICPWMGARFKQAEKMVERFLSRKIPGAQL